MEWLQIKRGSVALIDKKSLPDQKLTQKPAAQRQVTVINI